MTLRLNSALYTYSAAEANVMVADGSITNNPVFNRGYEPMFATNATPDEVMCALAKYVPAVSSAVGGRLVFSDAMDENNNLTSGKYRNGWGRTPENGALPWKHSDMKDMAYYYVYKLYEEIILKGALR